MSESRTLAKNILQNIPQNIWLNGKCDIYGPTHTFRIALGSTDNNLLTTNLLTYLLYYLRDDRI